MRLPERAPAVGQGDLRFNWGLRVPPELLADDADGKGAARAPISKMPLLVMSKISIEQSPRSGAGSKCARAEAEAEASDSDGDAAFSLVRQQLESLSVENMLLRRAVEDLRAEFRSGSRAPRPAAAAAGRVVATALQTQTHPRPQPYHARRPQRGAATAKEPAAAPDDVGEELKKALEARLR